MSDNHVTNGDLGPVAIEVGYDVRAAGLAESAKAALEGQSRFLDAAISSTPDFVYAFDRQRRFAYANPAMLNLFGLSADEMLGKSFADLNGSPELARLLDGHIDGIFAQSATVQNEVLQRAQRARRLFCLSVRPRLRRERGD